MYNFIIIQQYKPFHVFWPFKNYFQHTSFNLQIILILENVFQHLTSLILWSAEEDFVGSLSGSSFRFQPYKTKEVLDVYDKVGLCHPAWSLVYCGDS